MYEEGGKGVVGKVSHNCYSFADMARRYQYRAVDKLPPNAIKVSDYARQRGCHHSLIYHEVRRGKAKFEIVTFQGFNFIIPT